MKSEPTYITWSFSCDSPESRRKSEQLARQASDLNKVFVSVGFAFPNGIEEKTETNHRLGDYFDDVQVLTDSSTFFKMSFHPRQNAGRFWKDLMVQIIESIPRNVNGVSLQSMTDETL